MAVLVWRFRSDRLWCQMALAYFTLLFELVAHPRGGSPRWDHLSSQTYVRAHSGVWRGIPYHLNRSSCISCQTKWIWDASTGIACFAHSRNFVKFERFAGAGITTLSPGPLWFSQTSTREKKLAGEMPRLGINGRTVVGGSSAYPRSGPCAALTNLA